MYREMVKEEKPSLSFLCDVINNLFRIMDSDLYIEIFSYIN